MEMTSPFRLQKGDVPNCDRKPLDSLWFPWNRCWAGALDTVYLLPVIRQFRDIRLMFACKVRAEWTFLPKPKPRESRPSSWTVRSPPCDGRRRAQNYPGCPAAAGPGTADRPPRGGPLRPAVANRTPGQGQASGGVENRRGLRAYRQGRELGSRHRLAQGPAAWRLPASGERRCDRRGRAADFGAGTGVWRRVRPLLAARGPALRCPLRAQLGHGRLHRSRQPDRTRRSSRRRRCRPQSAACPVRRSSGRLQPLFAEQPAVSQRALYRRREASRNFSPIRNKRGAGAVAGGRCRDTSASPV